MASIGCTPSFSAPTANAVDAPFFGGDAKVLMNGLREWRGKTVNVYSPLYDEVTGDAIKIGLQAEMTTDDALEALNHASVAWNFGRGAWPSMTLPERAQGIRSLMAELELLRKDMVAALQWEIAKNPSDAATEFDRTILFLEEVIRHALAEDEAAHVRSISGVHSTTKRSGLGVTLACGPANYPLNETYATVIPALLMGNTCIMKVPRKGGLCHAISMAAFAKTLPPAVMNFVSGQGRAILGPLMSSGKVDLLSFVGSSKACEELISQHPKKHRLKTVLSLDAKNTGIVLPDCDLDLAAKECVLGATSFNGQRCTALKLLFVHRSVADVFVRKFCEKLNSGLRAGSQLVQTDADKGIVANTITPLACQSPNYIEELVQDACGKGARIMNTDGGKRDRTLIFPSVLYPVDASMRLYDEEQFGPCIPITVFEQVEEIEDYLDATKYGMQASVFVSTTPEQAGKKHERFPTQRLLHSLAMATCRVNLNMQSSRGPDALPFAGRRSTGRGVMGEGHIIPEVSIEIVLASKDKTLLDDVASGNPQGVLRSSKL